MSCDGAYRTLNTNVRFHSGLLGPKGVSVRAPRAVPRGRHSLWRHCSLLLPQGSSRTWHSPPALPLQRTHHVLAYHRLLALFLPPRTVGCHSMGLGPHLTPAPTRSPGREHQHPVPGHQHVPYHRRRCRSATRGLSLGLKLQGPKLVVSCYRVRPSGPCGILCPSP